MELQTYETTDSKLEHNNWIFPSSIKTGRLRKIDEEIFLTDHKIDKSYDDSTVRFKLLLGNATSANLTDQVKLPFDPDVMKEIKRQKWISDEYLHLWRRDEGGSAALTSHGILTFLLQTPRDSKSFCSLSLVNRERHNCCGLFITDENFALDKLLGSQPYLNHHPKVPRDFAILPFRILAEHVDETLSYKQELHRLITATERRIADGRINLDDNGDYKHLNRLNLEHVRLQRRSDFEIELVANLLKYLDAYHRLWKHLWEGGTSYIDDMREKIEQQMRFSEQTKKDLEMMPRRIDNQSKAMFNIIAQQDNKINISVAESSRKIAEESRLDNLLSVKLARATAQMAEETRQDSAAMKTIAVLTLTFLPGTAVASFFSMNNMFNWDPSDGQSIASPYLWVYFVVTIPVTALVYLAWLLWFKHTQAQYRKQNQDSDFAEVERNLLQRMRTATMTFDEEDDLRLGSGGTTRSDFGGGNVNRAGFIHGIGPLPKVRPMDSGKDERRLKEGN